MSEQVRTSQQIPGKDQPNKFERYVEVQTELLASGKTLVPAESYDNAYELFKRLIVHAERLRDDACVSYLLDRYATALALSVTCLEEIGKTGVARFQLVFDQVTSHGGTEISDPPAVSRKRRPFLLLPSAVVAGGGCGSSPECPLGPHRWSDEGSRVPGPSGA